MERIELHEIPAFSFGQVQDVAAGTGCTVILCPQGAVTGVDIRVVPGTRDTAALDPLCNRSVVHAVVLTGAAPLPGCRRGRDEKSWRRRRSAGTCW